MTQGYVALEMDGWMLGIPQSQVLSVESLADIEPPSPDNERWCIPWQGRGIPVLALDADARVTSPVSATGSLVAVMGSGSGECLGLVCTAMDVAEEALWGESCEIPAVMQNPEMFFAALAMYDDRLMCLAVADQLLPLLDVSPPL